MHSRPCSLHIQKASASFSCWFLCVASSVDPAWWSFYKTALFYSPFPISACCRRCSCSLHQASQNSTCTHMQIPRRATLMCLCGSTRKHIKKNVLVGFSHPHILIPTCRRMENTQEKKVHRRPSAGAVGDEGCKITRRPWGPQQVICLKHEQTEHTLT